MNPEIFLQIIKADGVRGWNVAGLGGAGTKSNIQVCYSVGTIYFEEKQKNVEVMVELQYM